MGVYQQGVPIEISDTFTVDGIATNPTLVTYTILGPDGISVVYTFPGSAEVSNPSVGSFLLSLAPPTLPGTYYYDVDATGAVVASRAASFSVLANVATAVDLDWAVVGPCTPWADSHDVWNCCGQPMVTIGEGSSEDECAVDMTQFAMEASQVLYELSGRLFSGTCEKTVRPCATRGGCGFQVLSRGHIVGSYGWNGAWWGSDNRPCGCRGLSRVLLSGYPIREIIEVKIDGDVVSDSTYRLDERRFLTRKDGALWPSCQALDLDDDEDGTFSVTYRYGQDPPSIGVAAAAQLGCELYKACQSGSAADCLLPSGVTRIVRQGITIEKQAFAAWAFSLSSTGGVPAGWHTGMSLVDAFLGAYARFGIPRRPTVWSPSASLRYARPVGQ